MKECTSEMGAPWCSRFRCSQGWHCGENDDCQMEPAD